SAWGLRLAPGAVSYYRSDERPDRPCHPSRPADQVDACRNRLPPSAETTSANATGRSAESLSAKAAPRRLYRAALSVVCLVGAQSGPPRADWRSPRLVSWILLSRFLALYRSADARLAGGRRSLRRLRR